MCFVVFEKALTEFQKKNMELAMRKKGILEVIVKTLMSLYALNKQLFR